MKPQRVNVSWQREEKFVLHVEEYSRFRTVVRDVLDFVFCVPFRHRFYWQYRLCNALSNWEADACRDLVKVPITREQADRLAYSEHTWKWLDDDE